MAQTGGTADYAALQSISQAHISISNYYQSSLYQRHHRHLARLLSHPCGWRFIRSKRGAIVRFDITRQSYLNNALEQIVCVLYSTSIFFHRFPSHILFSLSRDRISLLQERWDFVVIMKSVWVAGHYHKLARRTNYKERARQVYAARAAATVQLTFAKLPGGCSYYSSSSSSSSWSP